MKVFLLNMLDRAGRTAVQCVAGYVLAGDAFGTVNWKLIGLATALAVVMSVVQCVVDFPALPWGWWGDALGRAIRTFAQSLAGGGVGAAVLLTDVHWPAVLSAAGVAALSSVVTSVMTTPFGASRRLPALVPYPHSWALSIGTRFRVVA